MNTSMSAIKVMLYTEASGCSVNPLVMTKIPFNRYDSTESDCVLEKKG